MISCHGNGHGLSVTLSIFSFLCPFHPLCPFFFFPLCLFYPFGNQYIAILWHWILENEILMTSLPKSWDDDALIGEMTHNHIIKKFGNLDFKSVLELFWFLHQMVF